MEKRISRLIKMGLHLTEAGMPLIIKNDPVGLMSAAPSSADHSGEYADESSRAIPAPFTFLQLTLNFPPMLESPGTH